MIKVALTGGIATGKSYVLDCLRRAGIPCLDADRLAHDVTSAGTEAARAIGAHFGASMLDQDGALDRRKLGPLVFANPSARRALEAIVHPAVYQAIAAGLATFERTGAACAVVDIPLLYETNQAGDFDTVVATLCSPELQMERLRARGLGDLEAQQRLNAQLSAADKAARADHVIRTDGTFAETDAQVEVLRRTLGC
jgi:dephospho-CoA kinase